MGNDCNDDDDDDDVDNYHTADDDVYLEMDAPSAIVIMNRWQKQLENDVTNKQRHHVST